MQPQVLGEVAGQSGAQQHLLYQVICLDQALSFANTKANVIIITPVGVTDGNTIRAWEAGLKTSQKYLKFLRQAVRTSLSVG
jgi:hypothetical protein